MLFVGIPGLIYTLTRSLRADFSGDLFEAIMFLLIGIVSMFFAIRWARAVRRIFAGTSSSGSNL